MITENSSSASARPMACVIGDISMVRALGIRNIPVAFATSEADSKVAKSRYCSEVVLTPNWIDNPDRAVAAVIDWAKTQPHRPVLFYQGDHDLVAVSRARRQLADWVRLVLPTEELVEDLTDKLRFLALAEKHRLPIPDTLTVTSSPDDVAAARKWDRFPCVIKPAMRTNWFELIGMKQKALRIESRKELARLLPRLEEASLRFVVQVAVEGGEENILSYHAYVRESGEIAAEFTGKKIRTAPKLYGQSTYVEITDDPDVRALGRKTIEKIGFTGVLKIDFKRDSRSGQLYILEINPRFNLWHHPATVAGVAIPEAVYWDCIDPGRVEIGCQARKGVRWMAPMSDAAAVNEYRASGQLNYIHWLYQIVTADVNEGFMPSDPVPFFASLGKILRKRFSPSTPGA